jgi:hypothetical protein
MNKPTGKAAPVPTKEEQLADEVFQFMHSKRPGQGTAAKASKFEAQWLGEAAARFSLSLPEVKAMWDRKQKAHLAELDKIIATNTAVSFSLWR